MRELAVKEFPLRLVRCCIIYRRIGIYPPISKIKLVKLPGIANGAADYYVLFILQSRSGRLSAEELYEASPRAVSGIKPARVIPDRSIPI
jgi:hypothetical protein